MNDNEFAALAEEVGLISTMSDHPGWDAIVLRMQRLLYLKQKELIHGRATSLEDYKARVAWMDGASHVLDLPKNLLEALNSEIEARAERAA